LEGLTAQLLERLASNGPPLLFALTFLETCFITGLVVPAGVALLFASALAAVGTLSLAELTIYAVTGAALGDSVGFWVGRRGSESWRSSRLLGGEKNTARRARMERILAASPVVSISMARVVSFVRTVMPLAAGASEIGYRRFLAFDLLGIGLWAGVYVGVGRLAGEYGPGANGVLGVVGVVAFAIAVRFVLRKSRLEEATADGTVETTPPSTEVSTATGPLEAAAASAVEDAVPRAVALTGNVGLGSPPWPRCGSRPGSPWSAPTSWPVPPPARAHPDYRRSSGCSVQRPSPLRGRSTGPGFGRGCSGTMPHEPASRVFSIRVFRP